MDLTTLLEFFSSGMWKNKLKQCLRLVSDKIKLLTGKLIPEEKQNKLKEKTEPVLNKLKGVFSKIRQFCSEKIFSNVIKVDAAIEKMLFSITKDREYKLEIYSRLKKNPAYEYDQPILSDEYVKASEGEKEIKQFVFSRLEDCFLRIFPINRAWARIALTNRRIIFRTTGIKHKKKFILQQEFSVSDIKGVKCKSEKCLSPQKNFLGLFGLLCGFAVSMIPHFLFRKIKFLLTFFSLCSIYLFCKSYRTRHKNWLTLFVMSSFLLYVIWFRMYYTETKFFSFLYGIVVFVLAIMFIIRYVQYLIVTQVSLIANVDNELEICEPIVVQRTPSLIKKSGVPLEFNNSYLEAETETAFREIGCIIEDIKTIGDLAVEKWSVKNVN